MESSSPQGSLFQGLKVYLQYGNSTVAGYKTLSITKPTGLANRTIVANGSRLIAQWITSNALQNNITLDQAYNFVFGIYVNASLDASFVHPQFDIYRNGSEIFVCNASGTDVTLVNPVVRLYTWGWTSNQTISFLKGDRIIYKLFFIGNNDILQFVYDSASCPAFFYDPSSETLHPNAAGDLTQLSPFPNGPNYACVNETVQDGDTSYVEHDGAGTSGNYESDLYNLPATAILPTDTINSVTIYLYAKKMQVGAAIVTNERITVKTHGVVYTAPHALTTSYTDNAAVYDVNPNSSAAWTVDELNALQIGIDLQFQYVGDTRYSWGRATYLAAIITYTSGATKTWHTIATIMATLNTRQYNTISTLSETLQTRQWNLIATIQQSLNTRTYSVIAEATAQLLTRQWNIISSLTADFRVPGWTVIATVTSYLTSSLPLVEVVGMALLVGMVGLTVGIVLKRRRRS